MEWKILGILDPASSPEKFETRSPTHPIFSFKKINKFKGLGGQGAFPVLMRCGWGVALRNGDLMGTSKYSNI